MISIKGERLSCKSMLPCSRSLISFSSLNPVNLEFIQTKSLQAFFNKINTMDQNTMIIISVLLIGGFLGSFLTKVRDKQNSRSLVNNAKSKANSIIQKAKSEAENLKKD